MNTQEALFADILDSVDQLSMEEKETLIEVLHHRMTEVRQKEILQDIQEGAAEYESGGVRWATPDELLREITG